MSFDNSVGNDVLLRINQMVSDNRDAWRYEWEIRRDGRGRIKTDLMTV